MVSIVVPSVDALKSWAHDNHIPGTLSVLCNNAKVKELILNDMLNWGKQSGLKSFEQVCICIDYFVIAIETTNFSKYFRN